MRRRQVGLGRRTLLLAYAVIVVVPLLVVLTATFKTDAELFSDPFGLPSGLDPANYRTIFGEQELGRYFLNSVIVTAVSVPATLLAGSLAAFATSRMRGRVGWAIYGFFALGMTVPAQVNMIPQYALFYDLGLTISRIGLMLVNVVVTLPIAVFILGGFMRTLPRELFEAAMVDGAGPWRTYRSIAMPLSLPSLSATAIFLFVIHWNDLLYPLLFISRDELKTLPLALLDFKGEFLTDYPLLFTGVVVASAPIVVAYVFLQRYFVAGITAGGVKG